MCNYFFCWFHIAIILFFIGCGYKADPVWIDGNKKNEYNTTNDLKIIEINSTIKIK